MILASPQINMDNEDSGRVRPRDWTLTQKALDRFLDRLNTDRDLAGQAYESIRRKLMSFFRYNGHHEGEVLVDETLDRVIRKMDEVEINDLMSFIQGVARRVSSESHKSRSREIPLDKIYEPSEQPSKDTDEDLLFTRRLQCLEQCAARCLSHADRDLMFEFYRYDKSQKIENKKNMAQSLGITMVAFRVRAFRARQKLENCATDCMKAGSGQ